MKPLFSPYILDFYCAKARLAIEIDALVHTTQDHSEHDEVRDAWLVRQDIEALRIEASAVMADPDDIADGIWRKARARIESRN